MYRRALHGWMKHYDFLLLDLLLVQVAYLFAQWIRNRRLYPEGWVIYRTVNLVLLLAVVFAAVFLDVYKNILKRDRAREAVAVCKELAAMLAALFACLFFLDHESYFSRLVAVYFMLLTFLFLFGAHLLWKKWLAARPRRESTLRHMLLITDREHTVDRVQRMQQARGRDYTVSGLVIADVPGHVGEEVLGVPIVAEMRDALPYILDNWVDEVMLDLSETSEELQEIQNQCLEMGVTTHKCLPIDTARDSMQTVEKVAGSTVLTESIRITSARDQFVKRLLDIAGAVMGLIITGMLAIIFKIILQFQDPGPLFFSQERIGQNGRVFRIYKFRTMYMDAEKRKQELIAQNEMQGQMFKMKDDPRVIGSGGDGKKKGYGYFLRTTSLDEFPQFWNVLKGDMSLVGTRPPLPEEWHKYETHHRVRMAVKPGLTGLWQTSGRNKVTDFEEVIKYDREYITTWSLWGDVRIIFKTFGAMFRREGY